MKDLICVNVGQDHVYQCTTRVIGRAGESQTTQLQITIPDGLKDYWAYIDFRKPSGETIKTPRLEVAEGVATYDIQRYVLSESGDLEVQLVFQKESGEIWKSSVKKYSNLASINATDDIPDKEDFITEAQTLLDEVAIGSNALKGNKVGSAVVLDDISTVPHKLKVKAISKNLCPIFFKDTTYENGSTVTVNDDGSFDLCKMSGDNVFASTKIYLEGGTYTLSCTPVGLSWLVSVCIDGEAIDSTNGYITLPLESGEHTVSFFSAEYQESFGSAFTFYIQLEKGATATTYTPYTADVSTANVLRYGKNIVNIPNIDKSLASGGIEIPCYITAPITISGVRDNVVIQNPNGETTSVWRIQVKYESGKSDHIYDAQFPSKTFGATESDPIVKIIYRSVYIVSGQYKDIQVEYGTTATEYKPYIEPITYPISADGTVENVASLYPATILISDTEGIALDVEYNRDINKAFSELQNALISLKSDFKEVDLQVAINTNRIDTMEDDIWDHRMAIISLGGDI